MEEKTKKKLKIYCTRCDSLFSSKSQYEKHLEGHSGAISEVCPIDTAISKFIGMFKK